MLLEVAQAPPVPPPGRPHPGPRLNLGRDTVPWDPGRVSHLQRSKLVRGLKTAPRGTFETGARPDQKSYLDYGIRVGF